MSVPPSTPIRFKAAGASTAPSDHALCRSALWEALALGFRPPTVETVERLASRDGALALAAAAEALDGSAETDLAPRARALAPGSPVPLAALQTSYDRLFGHTARGGVPPYETEYGEDSLWEPPREMSDLGAFFRAFGLRLRSDARERPDHIACECEFASILARKEAHALALGDATMLDATRGAARLFLRDHLGRWAPAFAAKLAREDPDGFYGALGRLGAAWVAAECRRVGVAAGPEFLRLRSGAPDEAPMACGPDAGARGA
jgi:DMSO reductase family type II enzyme chaperone